MGRREKRRRPRVSFAPPAGRRWPAGRMRGGAVRPSLSYLPAHRSENRKLLSESRTRKSKS
ncbi:hypothetical protein CN137_21020 [Sinorhizobium meliloti]|nr:hypothetical protein CN137_21020 [Sinorhizobium meliloti]